MGTDRCRRAKAGDFSGVTGSRSLFISEVLSEAFVAVTEVGTEQAAATAAVVPSSAILQEPVQVTVDRSFVFLIRDGRTGTVLFVGRVLAPGA